MMTLSNVFHPAQGHVPDDIYGVQLDPTRLAANGKLRDDDGTELESISGNT